jgi:hypothetical protein
VLVSGRSETSSKLLSAAVLRNGLRPYRAIAAIAEVYLSLRKRGMPDNVSCKELCDQEMRLRTDDVLTSTQEARPNKMHILSISQMRTVI